MLATIALAAWWLLRERITPPVANPTPPPAIVPEPETPALDRARSLRADGIRACDLGDYRTCLDALDQARALDPEGDQDPVVAAVRAGAEAALRAPRTTADPDADSKLDWKPPRKGPLTTPSFKPVPTASPPDVSKDGSKKARPKKGATKAGDSDVSGTPGGDSKPSPRKRASTTVLDSPKYSP
jgi:hypothetical protein